MTISGIKSNKSVGAPLWIISALKFLNVKEITGERTSPEIKQFFQQSGHADVTSDEVPWCAAFVGAMLKDAGFEGTNSLMARSYLNWGRQCHAAETGAVAVFKRGDDPSLGHVGFVITSSKDEVYILGGNQSDRVSIESFSKKKLLSLRWPKKKIQTEHNIKRHQTFTKALKHILKLEGGWSNHPADKGGPTNKGITLSTFERAIKEGLITTRTSDFITELKNITDAAVEKIYYHNYWQKAGCHHLPKALAILHFDAAVNHGPRRAIKFLQQTFKAEIDGELGPETKSKIRADQLSFDLTTYTTIRKSYYQQLKQYPVFGKGWMNRLQSVATLSRLELSQNTDILNIDKKETTVMVTEDNASNTKWWGESLTVWGSIVTALSTILPVLGPFIGLDISAEMIEQLGETVTRLVQIIGGITGTTMTLYGRTRANTSLTRRAINVKL